MIYLLTGDNEIQINNFKIGRKREYSDLNIFDYSLSSDPVDIGSYLGANTLFNSKMLVLISFKNLSGAGINENFVKNISNDQDLELIIDSGDINKNTKIYGLFKRYSKLVNLEKPADYANFNISDAFFINKDLTKVFDEINKVKEFDDKFMPILTTFYNSIRNYVSHKYKNENWNKLHPYVKKKTASYPEINNERIIKIYEKLHELDVSNKSKSVDSKDLMMDFVLYFL